MTTIPSPPQVGDEFTNDATGISYRYDGFKWVVISTPESEDIEELTQRVTDGEAIQEDLVGRVTDGETLQGQIQDTITDALDTQSDIQGDITTLQNKVSALEGSVIDAVWSFEEDNRAPRDGEFGLRLNGAASSVWSTAQQIVISLIDRNGKTYTFDKVTVNDVIRIGAADSSSAEYRVTSIIVPGTFSVEHLRSSGAPTDEQDYAFTFLSAFDPEGLATIDYVDNQDNTRVKKSGDTMSGILETPRLRANGEGGARVFEAQQDGTTTAWFNSTGQVRTNYIVTESSEDKTLTTRRYVDDKVGNELTAYLPLSGGTLTGALTLESSQMFTVKDANGNENFRIQANGFCRTLDLFRAQRDDGGPALQARVGSSLNAEIRCDGKATFKNDVTFRDGGRIYVNRSSNESIIIQQNGTNKGKIWADGTFETEKTSFTDKHLVTKKYVDDEIDGAVRGGAVEISNGSLPPAAKERGTLLLTASNNLYIYM